MATTDPWLFALPLASALGSGLIAGAFFAFSSFVMGALARIQPAQGISAMQSINVVVINPLFMLVFLGTAVCCLILAVVSLLKWHQPGAALLLAGSLLYVVGTFGVTMVFNVPLNNRLAAQDPGTAEAARYWLVYLTDWLRWNHVRTLASLLATASLLLAIHKARLPVA